MAGILAVLITMLGAAFVVTHLGMLFPLLIAAGVGAVGTQTIRTKLTGGSSKMIGK